MPYQHPATPRHPWLAALLVLLVLLACPFSAQAQPTAAAAATAATATAVDARSSTGTGPVVLPPHTAALEDPSGQWTLQDVLQPANAARFAPGQGQGEAFNFGITPSAWWFRITLANPGNEAITRLLEVAYARLSHISLHQVLPDGSVHTLETGGAAPFASRPYAHRFFVFPLQLPAGATYTYYLRVQSLTAFIVPLRLWEPEAFHAHERTDYLTQAWYFGMVSAMVLFNLLLLAGLRERIYLYYLGFALCTAFALAAQNGLVKEFLRLDKALASDLAATLGYSWAIASGLQFMRHMLDTAHTLARADAWLLALVGFFVLSPLVFVFTGQTFIQTAALVYLGAIVVAMAVGLHGVFKRQRAAYFFVGAFLVLALGAMVNALRAIGHFPTNPLTANAMQLGSALEMVLLAFALADRFNQMRRDKALMQQKLLHAQTDLINTLRKSEQQLEKKVHERTVELEVINRQLAALSMTDGLTGIANRRHFDQTLETEWQRARRNNTPLSLALLDVDWFKQFNDHLGHQAGDDCLRSIAQVLASNVQRTTDLAARYGGEEFALLVPETSSTGVVEMGQKIQVALQKMALAHPQSPYGHTTVSIGVASLVPGPGDTAQTLVRLADQALYRAKAEGRNRIVLA